MKTLLCCRPLPSRSCWSIPHRSCPSASAISFAQHRLLPDPCLRGSSLPSTSLRSSSLPGSPYLFDDWLPKSRFQAPASAFQIPVNRVTGQPVQWPRRPKIFQIFRHSIHFNNFSQDNQWLQRTTRQQPTLLWLRPPALQWRDSPSRSVLDRSRSFARCNLKYSLF